MRIDFERKAIEWTIASEKTFGVQIRAWKTDDRHYWNVYALIFEGHPLHKNPAGALELPFHCGATYDKRIITSPANGEISRFAPVTDLLKVGSDYQHYMDDYESCDPLDGIPTRIQSDARELAECLEAMQISSMVPA